MPQLIRMHPCHSGLFILIKLNRENRRLSMFLPDSRNQRQVFKVKTQPHLFESGDFISFIGIGSPIFKPVLCKCKLVSIFVSQNFDYVGISK